MLIHRMAAVFGPLQNRTLELGDGLNIIQSSDEAENSAWCAFLLSMLYGFSGQEQEQSDRGSGKIPGAAVSGQLDCRADDQEFTLLRTAHRQGSSGEEFRAVYAGTNEQVSGLTGQACGEALLGVSREVYHRAAFIRQPEASAAREPSAGFSAAIRGQASRQGKSNRIPALEAQLREAKNRLARLEELETLLAEAAGRIGDLAARESDLSQQLSQRERQDAAQQQIALEAARDGAQEAQQRALELQQQLEDGRVPELDAIARLRAAIVNLEMSRKTLVRMQDQRDQARKAQAQAERDVGDHPFADMIPEEAEDLPLDLPPRPRFPLWGVILALVLGLGLGLALYFAQKGLPLAVGCGCGLGGLCTLILGLLTAQKQHHWEPRAETLRQQRSQDLKRYSLLYQTLLAARAETAARSAAYDSLNNTLDTTEQAILQEVRGFAPEVSDIPGADEVLRLAAARRKELAAAEAGVREAQGRCETLSRQAPPEEAGRTVRQRDLPPPEGDRAALSAELNHIREELANARAEAESLSDQRRALCDPASPDGGIARFREEIARLERERDIAALALEALEDAGASPRISSPRSLSARTEKILRELTGGAAQGRDASPSPEDSASLPAGDAGQLYLAARLAICQLCLPAEDPAPMILDGALDGFDSPRRAAALNWLRREAKRRQILLFTRRGQEAAAFAGDPAVRVQRLTDAP